MISFSKTPPNPFYGVLASASITSGAVKTQNFSGYAWGSSVVGVVDMSGVKIASNIITTPSCAFTPALSTIIQGDSVDIYWSGNNITSCTASGGSGGWSGSKPISGNSNVSPSSTTTYSMSCLGNDGVTMSPLCSATVNVTTCTVTNDPTNPACYCSVPTNLSTSTCICYFNPSDPLCGGTHYGCVSNACTLLYTPGNSDCSACGYLDCNWNLGCGSENCPACPNPKKPHYIEN